MHERRAAVLRNGRVPQHAELDHVKKLRIEDTAEDEVVGPLLVVIAQAEQCAVCTLAEELQRLLVACLKRPHLILA